jgi:HK97 family phage prohead protease
MNLCKTITADMPDVDKRQALSAYMERVKQTEQHMVCKIDSPITEVKQDGEEYYMVEGYASTFGNVDKGCDRIEKGAFNEDLAVNGPERSILWQHNTNEPIGMGIFSVDDTGLYVKAMLPKEDAFVKNRVYPQLRIGSVKKFSIGYMLQDYNIVEEDGMTVYNLTRIALKEASPVTFPMNEQADILTVKSEIIDELKKELKPVQQEAEVVKEEPLVYECKYTCLEDNFLTEDSNFDDMPAFMEANDIKAEDVSFTINDKSFYFAGISNDEIVVVPSRVAMAIEHITDDMKAEKAVINAYYVKLGKVEPFKEDGSLFIDKYTLRHMSKKAIKKALDNGVEFSGNAKDLLVEAVSLTKGLGEKHEKVNEKEDSFDLLGTIGLEFSKQQENN